MSFYGIVLIVLSHVLSARGVSHVIFPKPLQYVGKLSYSIYMTHVAILFCLISTILVLQKITGVEMTSTLETTRYLNFGNSFINNLVVLLMLAVVIYISSLWSKIK